MIRETLMQKNKTALLLATILLVGPVVAAAQQYTVTNLGVLSGLANSYGTAINERGEVTGYSQPPMAGAETAFLYRNGTLQTLGTPSDADSVAYGINSNGQVTGYTNDYAFIYSNGTLYVARGLHTSIGYAINESGQITGGFTPDGCCGELQAFLYSNGTTKNIGTLGGTTSIGYGINASGQVTGYSWITGSTQSHAFLYSNGSMQDLGTLGGVYSEGQAINASGEVTGGSATARDNYGHAFLYSNGTMQDLGTFPGGLQSYGYGINASGEVTGYSYTRDREIHAFLYRNARMIDLNSQISSTDAQTYTLTSGRAINDKGQIVVDATVNATGVSAALLLTPTMENPESN